MKTIILTDVEFRLLREMVDSWVPSTPIGKVTESDDKITTAIADKIHDIRNDEGCQGIG